MLAANGLTELLRHVHSRLKDPRDADLLLSAQNLSGNTPLHWAIVNSHLETARVLLELGTDANLINEKGETPLDTALLYERDELVPLLSQKTLLKDTDLDDDAGGIPVVRDKGASAQEFEGLLPGSKKPPSN